MDAIALMGDAVFPVCHARLGAKLREPADLVQQRLLHVMGNRRGWAEWLAMAGITAFGKAAVLQTESTATAIVLAEQAVGVALGHSSLVMPLLEQGRLTRPFPRELETVGIFYLMTPSAQPLRRQARHFLDWLLAEGANSAGMAAEPATAES
jgi:LysR family glycine cleavage system transcriptional activator